MKIDCIEHVLLVCYGSDCKKNGARDVFQAAKGCVRDLGRKRSTHIVKTKCNGMCKQGPIISHQPSNTWVTEATAETARGLIRDKLGDLSAEPE
ncbi:MAG: (2Fe-2S) ferredoxin domain-containing protein [Bradymonadaceae bacterium]